MVEICGIKMISAQDLCESLKITKETAYGIIKAKESGARFIGRKLLISEDNLRKYLNNEKTKKEDLNLHFKSSISV
ncbi:MAG: helix-turn-helix domain-containing protein [Clostridia bacterium]|nr:helix-turn-helix domain-containing protein [Clostridia bacterium]